MTKLSGPMLAPANGQAPDAAVVLLHGYGSDGNDLIAMAPHFQHLLPGALFVSPHAPTPLGMGGYQWFPIDWSGDRLASRQTGVIGARHAVYSRAQVNDKSWLKTPPTDLPLAEPADSGRLHHFLLHYRHQRPLALQHSATLATPP